MKPFSLLSSIVILAHLLPQNYAVDYGVDISFPIHRREVSTNYAWLPHNVDPDSNPTPSKYHGMPVQPLGDVKKFYDHFMQGCYDEYQKGKSGGMCDSTESGRVAMSLRQPKT